MRIRSIFSSLAGAVLLAACGGSQVNTPEAESSNSDALGATVLTLEAETFSLPSGQGKVFDDSSASAGKALEVSSNGTASITRSTPAADHVVLRVRGDQCQGAPSLKLSVDGRAAASFTVSGTSWAKVSAPVALAAGSHTFTVGFDNDLYVKGTCDRNLRVDTLALTAGTSPLTLDTALALNKTTLVPGDTLSGTVTYKNTGANSVTIKALVITARTPGASHSGWVTGDDFTPTKQNFTVAPGAKVTLTASRPITSSDPTGSWVAYSTYQDAQGTWHDSADVAFTVTTQIKADVTVTVDKTKPLITTSFGPGATLVKGNLQSWNDPGSLQAGGSVLQRSVVFQNQHLMGWGADDPWPDPSTSEPTDWSELDYRMNLAASLGTTPILTLCEAPWWMKGISQSDEWNSIAYNSRIQSAKMSAWLHLVRRAVERYSAPPYNVQYFQVWNELKGYYDDVNNHWDYVAYTDMYNQVYDLIKSINPALKVGGPYVVVDSWADPSAGGYPHSPSYAWGTLDKRSLDVISYWLQNKHGADFIAVDSGNDTREGTWLTDAFTATDKFVEIVRWIRQQPSGGGTLPIIYSEFYAWPSTSNYSEAEGTAVAMTAWAKVLRSGVTSGLIWGAEPEDGVNSFPEPFFTSTANAGGGVQTRFGAASQALKANFPAGTTLYTTSVSGSGVEVLASANHVLLINQRNQSRTVAVNGTVVTLAAFEVRVL